MTDATHRVTQSTVEAFAREYLRTLGGSIRENETHWRVTLPSDVDVGFASDSTFDLLLTDDETGDRDEFVLTPESEFTRQLLDDASGANPVGTVTLTDDLLDKEYLLSEWLTNSPLTVTNASFSPYYDRTALSLRRNRYRNGKCLPDELPRSGLDRHVVETAIAAPRGDGRGLVFRPRRVPVGPPSGRRGPHPDCRRTGGDARRWSRGSTRRHSRRTRKRSAVGLPSGRRRVRGVSPTAGTATRRSARRTPFRDGYADGSSRRDDRRRFTKTARGIPQGTQTSQIGQAATGATTRRTPRREKARLPAEAPGDLRAACDSGYNEADSYDPRRLRARGARTGTTQRIVVRVDASPVRDRGRCRRRRAMRSVQPTAVEGQSGPIDIGRTRLSILSIAGYTHGRVPGLNDRFSSARR